MICRLNESRLEGMEINVIVGAWLVIGCDVWNRVSNFKRRNFVSEENDGFGFGWLEAFLV